MFTGLSAHSCLRCGLLLKSLVFVAAGERRAPIHPVPQAPRDLKRTHSIGWYDCSNGAVREGQTAPEGTVK